MPHRAPPDPGTVLVRYDALVAAGELRADPDQRTAAVALDTLQRALEAGTGGGGRGEAGGWGGRLLGGLRRLAGGRSRPPGAGGGGPGAAPDVRGGVYLWGGVGRGKSMLMDLFADCVRIGAKRRVHFHAFMIDVHASLREARRDLTVDPVRKVADAIAADTRLLAFDEMVINNSADAMILSRLFTALVEGGVSIVATSNRPPADLYKDGLNREHFLPFIALIERRLRVIALQGPVDYRRERLGDAVLWHAPADDAATAALSRAFYRLTDYPPEDAAHVPSVMLDVGGGRTLRVPKALKGVAVFSFRRLCGEARGAGDYLAIARTFHTVILVGIPVLGPEQRNEAARFVILIDALYEHRVKLLASAAAAPDALYVRGDGAFEFERTASRLAEMQSDAYLAQPHGGA